MVWNDLVAWFEDVIRGLHPWDLPEPETPTPRRRSGLWREAWPLVPPVAVMLVAMAWLIFWPPAQIEVRYANRTELLYAQPDVVAPLGPWAPRGQRLLVKADKAGWSRLHDRVAYIESAQLSHLPRPRLNTEVQGLRKALMTVDVPSEPDFTGHALLEKDADYVVVGEVIEGRSAGMWEVLDPAGGVAYASRAVFDASASPAAPPPPPIVSPAPSDAKKPPKGGRPVPGPPSPPIPPPLAQDPVDADGSVPFLKDRTFASRANLRELSFDSPGAPRAIRITVKCQISERQEHRYRNGKVLAGCEIVSPDPAGIDRHAAKRALAATKAYVLPERTPLLGIWIRYTLTMTNRNVDAID